MSTSRAGTARGPNYSGPTHDELETLAEWMDYVEYSVETEALASTSDETQDAPGPEPRPPEPEAHSGAAAEEHLSLDRPRRDAPHERSSLGPPARPVRQYREEVIPGLLNSFPGRLPDVEEPGRVRGPRTDPDTPEEDPFLEELDAIEIALRKGRSRPPI